MLSLLVATASAALGLLAAGRMRWAAGGMVVVAAGAWLVLGWVGGGAVTTNDLVRIAAVQTNLPMDNKVRWGVDRRVADFVRFVERTREAAAADPDVIVWPETMFPGQTLDPESLAAERRTGLAWNVTTRGWIPSTTIADELLLFQAELGAPMVVGATGYRGLTFEPDGEGVRRDWEGAYNAAMVVSGGEVSQRWYAKLHLTPFGEVMPGISRFPSLERALLSLGAAGMSFDLDAGDDAVTLNVPTRRRGPVRIGTPICFEATAAWVCRRLVDRDDGARVLVNLTNDGWFGDFDLGRRWHTMHARWRCVELGVPMVRAANTGASCAIDGRGRITAELGPREAGVLVAEVALADEETRTVYRAGGWMTPWVLMLGALGLVLWALLGAAARTNSGRGAGEVQSGGARGAEGGADA
ncbi:MAG: apolipoprotein N-acyltransferase [Planctomycetota bacterium]